MKDDLIRDLVEKEWKMFSAVQNIGGPADCQSDRKTFEIMRQSQFEAWPDELLLSYRADMDAAIAAGRNLLTEKYGRMMGHTLPAQYDRIAASLPPVSKETRDAADRIAKKMADQQAALQKKYPLLAGRGRPIYASGDTVSATSLETYAKGELLTYSIQTLRLLEKTVDGSDIALKTLQNTVRYYGYASLEDAEQQLKARAQRPRPV